MIKTDTITVSQTPIPRTLKACEPPSIIAITNPKIGKTPMANLDFLKQ